MLKKNPYIKRIRYLEKRLEREIEKTSKLESYIAFLQVMHRAVFFLVKNNIIDISWEENFSAAERHFLKERGL
jgi:hypothetical protein